MIKYLCLRYNMSTTIAITQATGFGNDAFFTALFHKMNGGTYFRCHGTFREMTFLNVLFCLGNTNHIQSFFPGFRKLIYTLGTSVKI